MSILDRKLRIFQMAAQLRHFSETAAALGMSQPNVTQQIARLEREFGTPLFLHEGRSVKLTEAGEVLLKECEILFGDAAAVRRRVLNAAATRRRYRLGGTLTAGGFLLPELTADFLQQNFDCLIDLTVGNTDAIEEMLKRRILDLALIEGPFDRDFFTSVKLCDDELIAVAAPGMLSSHVSLKEQIAAGQQWILRESGSGTRYSFDGFVKQCSCPPPRAEDIMEVNNFDAMKRLAALGRGVAVVSLLAVKSELAAGTLAVSRFEEGVLNREFNFLYLAQENWRFAERFIRFCQRRRNAL